MENLFLNKEKKGKMTGTLKLQNNPPPQKNLRSGFKYIGEIILKQVQPI